MLDRLHFQVRRDSRIVIAAIVLLAFGLRVHELGADSLWNDEAGQVLAALEPTLMGMIEVERSHAMALPLDYLTTRAISNIGIDETILRFPSALWGTLAVAVLYVTVRRFASGRAALVASYLLAISAFHIHYSQEARFYASLVFFYCLASYLVIRALEDGGARTWTAYTAVALTGTYFHPYVIMSLANGYTFVMFAGERQDRGSSLRRLTLITITLVASFAPAYLYFGRSNYSYELLQFSDSLLKELMRGIDWIPFWPSGLVMALLFSLGLGIVALRHKTMFAWVLAGMVQIPLIIFVDWQSGYWFTGRQIVHVLPVALAVIAVGAAGLVRLVSGQWGEPVPAYRNSVLTALFLFVLTLLSASKLNRYYQWPKSSGREVTAQLIEHYEPNTRIYVEPPYEEKIYRYYLSYVYDRPDIVGSLEEFHLKAFAAAAPEEASHELLVAASRNAERLHDSLLQYGYVAVPQPVGPVEPSHILFVRDASQVR